MADDSTEKSTYMEFRRWKLLAVRISNIAPWKKIYAIDTIVLLRLQYKMRVAYWTLERYDALRKKLIRAVRHICALLKLASAEYVFIAVQGKAWILCNRRHPRSLRFSLGVSITLSFRIACRANCEQITTTSFGMPYFLIQHCDTSK